MLVAVHIKREREKSAEICFCKDIYRVLQDENQIVFYGDGNFQKVFMLTEDAASEVVTEIQNALIDDKNHVISFIVNRGNRAVYSIK